MSDFNISAQNLSNPSWLKPAEGCIPEFLKKQPFGVWRAEPRKGKPGKFNKAPLSPKTGRKIGANKPELFGTYDEAMTAYKTGDFTGIGMLLTGNGIVGIDIDDYESVFQKQPAVKDWLEKAISVGTYCEYSPSNTGLRLFLSGRLNSHGKKSDGLEIYDDKRFLTVTGHLYAETAGRHDIVSSQELIDEFLRLIPNRQTENAHGPDVKIAETATLQKIDEICAAVEKQEPLLWSGNWQKDKFNIIGYPSQSEGDMALTGVIAKIAVGMQLPESKLAGTVYECFIKSGMHRPEKTRTLVNHTIPKAIKSALSGAPKSNSNFSFNLPSSIGITAEDLAKKQFPPINWVVEDILPEGAYLLSARPKVGKSWLALQLSLAVAFGDQLWGKNVKQGRAVYLALEENQRRLQTRLNQLRSQWDSPDLLLFTSYKRSDQGGLDDLEKLLKDFNPRLLVIDTLAKFRAPASKGGSAYEADYNALAPLTELANKYHCCILIVTHNRKGKSEGDAIEMVSGTLGQMGAVDGALVIDGDRGDEMMRLTLVGRDIEHDGEFAITKRKQGGWDWQGNASQAFASTERQQILKLLKSIPGGLKPSEVADRLCKSRSAVRKLMSSMALDMQIKRDTKGIYSV